MKKKLLFGILWIPLYLQAQVFEKQVYPVAQDGDVELRESIVTKAQHYTTFCSAGYYYYDQGGSGYYRPVLYNRNPNGSTNFEYSYIMKGASSGTYNAKSFAVAEDSISGFITAGVISDFGSNTVNGGSDILLLKYDANGMLTKSKQIDFGYAETAYDIINKDGNYNKFIICGTAQRATGTEVFVAEIDRNLNVNWVTRMALKITTTQTTVTLYSLAIDGSGNIWAVGSLLPAGSLNFDHLLVKLNSSGTYQYAERFYNGTNREILKDISVASDGKLLLTGSTKSASIFSSTLLFIGKYDPSTRTLSQTQILRTTSGGSQRSNIGEEIIEVTNPSTSVIEYFVVGSSSLSGVSAGLFYKLDANFSASYQRLFQSNNNVQFYDIEYMLDNSNTPYLNYSGIFSRSGSYKAGYDVKSDMNGYTSCSDSLVRDTLANTLSIDTLSDSLFTTYNTYVVDTTFAELTDSVSCLDENGFTNDNEQRVMFSNISSEIYPNPVNAGHEFVFFTDSEEGEIIIYSSTGQLIYRQFYSSSGLIKVTSAPLENGIYLVNQYDRNHKIISSKRLMVIK